VHHSQWGVFFWSFVIVLILGIIMAVTGFMGCFGAALENQCLMGTVSYNLYIISFKKQNNKFLFKNYSTLY